MVGDDCINNAKPFIRLFLVAIVLCFVSDRFEWVLIALLVVLVVVPVLYSYVIYQKLGDKEQTFQQAQRQENQ